MQSVPDLYLFFGRFHPLFVHLPIGILCLAIVLEVFARWQKTDWIRRALPLVWLLAAVGAVFSAITGYLLSQGGGYAETILGRHQTGGILLAALTSVMAAVYRLPVRFRSFLNKPVSFSITLLITVLLVVTSHMGGSLTHGEAYLTEYSPFHSATESKNGIPVKISGLDSADIFRDAVMPILQAKCTSCHNAEKKKGELELTSYAAILKGGKTRAGIVPGNTATSELFRRITLPKDHKEFMPGNGKRPLTDEQVAILEWWIETGAHRDIWIADLKPDKKMQELFNEFFQIGRDALLSYSAPPAAKNDLVALLQAGYQVHTITETNNLLEIKFQGSAGTKPDLKLLSRVRDQLVWLHLPQCGLNDEDLKPLGQLTNLYKLNLNRNPITDTGLQQLMPLTKLENLNVYGTAVSNNGIRQLATLPNLRKLYVWETRADSTGLQTLQPARKELEVVYKLNP